MSAAPAATPATGRAAQAAPDGYTIFVTGGNHLNNPFLYNHVPYDPIKDFDAVTLGGQLAGGARRFTRRCRRRRSRS